jgi:putative isomerase
LFGARDEEVPGQLPLPRRRATMLRTAAAAMLLAGLARAAPAAPAAAGLTMTTYGNTAITGTPLTNTTVPGLDLTVPFSSTVGSAEVTGVVTFAKETMVAFECTFDPGQIAFVWIRDHLVCHTRPVPFGNTPSSTDGCPEYPLPVTAGQVDPVVVHVYNVNATAPVKISVQWAEIDAPMAKGSKPPTVPVTGLSPALPPSEIQRRALQDELKTGWSTWSYNMLGVVRLPDSSALTTAICQISSGDCLVQTHIEDPAAEIRVGVFATDLSYWQFYLGYKGVNVSLSYSGGTGPLNMIAEPIGCGAAVNCSDYALVVLPRFAWFRQGDVKVDASSGSISLTPMGLPARNVMMTRAGDSIALNNTQVKGAPQLVFGLGQGKVGMQESSSSSDASALPTVDAISKVIQAAHDKEYASYTKYGEYAEVKEGLQAATMWNYIYTPAEYGPFMPVSRQWDFVKFPVNLDWGYVIFDWDNIFATYMTSLSSKEIAYSNFIQVIRSKTAMGFVPNYSAGGTKSIDRTEPPIGAKVMLEMYKKFKDEWIVELLFDDLLAWNDWFVAERMLGPLGIVSLGSDTIDGYVDAAAGEMQGARYESGLDNSPMYDGTFFKKGLKTHGTYSIGQMEMYDVGMASMFVSEADALTTLATTIGRTAEATKLKARADKQRALIAAHMWDEQGGIYTNLFWNETFYRRISPTSFYSMMAKAPTDEQATKMVNNWLHSPEHFCIAPNGDFAGNKDTCYWGLPSIEASDPAFPPLGYWRGYVWGPMAQLTYWSLQEYDHVPAVKSGRKALCKQMTALMLSQWRGHRHICENYSPHKTADDHQGDCSGTKFCMQPTNHASTHASCDRTHSVPQLSRSRSA